MLDNRLKTFLDLCTTLNYTNTAKRLHMTQPAVSQHIKYLEDFYNVKLFDYDKRVLSLSESGKVLYNFVIGIKASTDKLENIMKNSNHKYKNLKFGATLTIGEYIMPKLLIGLEREYPDIEIDMLVSNTEKLLAELERGHIDFAIIEGHFDKTLYESYLFSEENFIGISCLGIYKNRVDMEDLYKEKLIIRERGSGTREILEQILYEKNLKLENFKKINQISSMNVIKEMVENNMGITFLYEKAVRKELRNKSLEKINIKDFSIYREFNFVFLKNNIYRADYMEWYRYFLENFISLYDNIE